MVPKWAQNWLKIVLGLSWALLGLSWVPSWPKSPKTAPRRPQDGPRWPQDGPKTAQDGPRWPQDSPKTAPRRPQDGPESPKTVQDCIHKTSSLSPLCPKRPLKVLQTELVLKNFGERPPVRRRRPRFGRSLALAKVGRVEILVSNLSVLVCLSLS